VVLPAHNGYELRSHRCVCCEDALSPKSPSFQHTALGAASLIYS
jgi:hypothetical protein